MKGKSNQNASSPGVLVSVADTGEGMSKETAAHIFEPFYTTKGIGKGTGLGLATVYGIVDQHQGQVEVISSPGEGATFEIRFPEVAEAAPVAAEAVTGILSGGCERILVVEDDDNVRCVVEEMLKSVGFHVWVSNGFAEAIACFEKEIEGHLDLLVTDLVMPGTNGLEISEHFQKRISNLKVLFMTGHSETTILNKHWEAKRETFIQKPFRREQLIAKVRALLDMDTSEHGS